MRCWRWSKARALQAESCGIKTEVPVCGRPRIVKSPRGGSDLLARWAHDRRRRNPGRRRHHFDLIVLDVMLPHVSGLDVLRQSQSTPVLMLTALGEDVDRVVGRELRADDYLPKPFNPRELVARMCAILRRSLMLEPQGTRHQCPRPEHRADRGRISRARDPDVAGRRRGLTRAAHAPGAELSGDALRSQYRYPHPQYPLQAGTGGRRCLHRAPASLVPTSVCCRNWCVLPRTRPLRCPCCTATMGRSGCWANSLHRQFH